MFLLISPSIAQLRTAVQYPAVRRAARAYRASLAPARPLRSALWRRVWELGRAMYNNTQQRLPQLPSYTGSFFSYVINHFLYTSSPTNRYNTPTKTTVTSPQLIAPPSTVANAPRLDRPCSARLSWPVPGKCRKRRHRVAARPQRRISHRWSHHPDRPTRMPHEVPPPERTARAA